MKELQDIDLLRLIEEETGQRRSKVGAICCPFHNEKTPSFRVRFDSNKNKQFYHCFGCGEHGDAIDFITKYKNLSYVEAKKYLGLEVNVEAMNNLKKIESRISWELSEFRAEQKLLGIFEFYDRYGNLIYYKAKFQEGNKKVSSYYHLDQNGKVVNTRYGDEVPYNYHKALQQIERKATILIVEGEKDANMVNSLRINNIFAISVKGIKNKLFLQDFLKGANVALLGDTGEAGELYIQGLKFTLIDYVNSLKIVKLPYLSRLGDNKDVSDWLEQGFTKEALKNAIENSLDLKNKNLLQQNKKGIKKTILKQNKDNEIIEKAIYLTNFSILEAKKIVFIAEKTEGIKLTLRTDTGEVFERLGNVSIFDDVRAFKSFLGALNLTFNGRLDNLTELKMWISKYFAIEKEEIYSGTGFLKKDDKLNFICSNGALRASGKIIDSIKGDSEEMDILEVEKITKEELEELSKYLFSFSSKDKTYSILGTVFNNFMVLQNTAIKAKLHHLLIVGESGSGKSTVLENVVAALLNQQKKDIKSIGLITRFALINTLSNGNYTSLYDEFKPSMMDKYAIANLSEILRNSYDRATVSRANKNFETKSFELTRPLIMAGEESYPNSEKALIERSIIVYLSKNQRTQENTIAMKWIIKNENLLYKLGRSLVEKALNISVNDYENMRDSLQIPDINNRPLNTVKNILAGIELFNKLAVDLGANVYIADHIEPIIRNVKEELFDDGNETFSIVEQMIILYNDMICDSRARSPEEVIRFEVDGLYIRTEEMINQINLHVKNVNAGIIPLGIKDFKKQAKKAGIIGGSSESKLFRLDGKTVRYDKYNETALEGLNIQAILYDNLDEVAWRQGNLNNVKEFKPVKNT